MQRVFMLCGVPGSGKSFVAEKLSQEFTYIANDDFIGEAPDTFPNTIYNAATVSQKPVLCDCPFGERKLREALLFRRLHVTPVFIVEHPDVIRRRYEGRDKKPVYKGLLTRAVSIAHRAHEWNAFSGTSQEVLKHLKELSRG